MRNDTSFFFALGFATGIFSGLSIGYQMGFNGQQDNPPYEINGKSYVWVPAHYEIKDK